MITRMKKISLLVFHGDKDPLLADLQKLGVVHITENPARDLTGTAASADLVKRSEIMLKQLVTMPPCQPSAATVDSVAALEQFEAVSKEKASIEQSIVALEREIETVSPWGDFSSTSIQSLIDNGCTVQLYTAQSKLYDTARIQSISGYEIARMDDTVYFAVINNSQVLSDAENVRLPGRSLKECTAALAVAKGQLEKNHQTLMALAAAQPAVKKLWSDQKNLHAFLTAQGDSQQFAEGTVHAFTGYFPVKAESKLASVLNRYTAWFETATPQSGEDVPIEMVNGPFARLFEPITRLYMLPNYWEFDPTPFFAPAFAFFVGLCLGDVGYGSIVLLLSTVAFFKAPASFKSFATLIMILGGITVLCGVLLNSFFGAPLFGGTGISGSIFPSGAAWFSPLSSFEGVRGTEYPAMGFALVVGFLQMMFAMVLQMINRIRNGSARTAILPLSWMLMLVGVTLWEAHTNWFDLRVHELSISRLHLGALMTAIPVIVGKTMCLGGVGLMFLSNLINGSGNPFIRPLVFIWDFYNFATGNMGYIISYIRLFALGLTGGLLGSTFTMLALGFITKDGVVNWLSPMVVCTVLLLVAGHALNFALAIVGSFVHPLRLTFVEFYQTLQFSGGGRVYAPLKKIEP